MYTDCIFFEETYEELPQYRHCIHSKSLFKKGDEDHKMCQFCRLWDAYIPKTATEEEKETAIAWQNCRMESSLITGTFSVFMVWLLINARKK